ncbi:MAG: GNAT family N-acetyltransferase [Coriobacteriia bacterium]|nr:GNAT family N-acetyltransferase [Coriobacteriia bacterium]
MTRRFKPLTGELVAALPTGCPGCVFWESPEPLEPLCGVKCDEALASGWMDRVRLEWGDCGRAAVEDGVVLGFIKYAPPGFFPQARLMPAGPPDDKAVLIACMHISPDARQKGLGKILMQVALRDLVMRGEKTVQAYGTVRQGSFETSPVVGVEFLLRMGFTVARPHPRMPLMQLDLRSVASWTENLEAVLESLRIPIGVTRRRPAINCRKGNS